MAHGRGGAALASVLHLEVPRSWRGEEKGAKILPERSQRLRDPLRMISFSTPQPFPTASREQLWENFTGREEFVPPGRSAPAGV